MNAQYMDHHHAAWAKSFGAELQSSTVATPGQHSAPPEPTVTAVVGNGSGNMAASDDFNHAAPVSYTAESSPFHLHSDSTTLDHHGVAHALA